MSIEGLIGLVVMVIMGLVGIGLPFLTTKSSTNLRKRELDMTRDELITTYERVLSSLRDLEDDYKSHKIHAADYEYEHEYWSQYGIRLLQLLDGNDVDESDSIETDDDDLQLDHSVEEAIKNYRVALQSVEKA